MAKQKSTLTLGKINKEAKKYNETELFEFSNGETLKIFPLFRPSVVEVMLEEYGEKLQIFEEELGEKIDDKFSVYYLHFLCIKYFTDLQKYISDDPKEQLKNFHNIIDSFYFKEIVEEAFLKEEIVKVWDVATTLTATHSQIGNLDKLLKEKIDSLDLQNRDILFPQQDTENKNVQ
jgi:hypothetical protein